MRAGPATCDLPLKGHQFGLKLMTWAIATAKVAGFRAAPVVMQLACVFFGVVLDLPDWTAIRIWLIRAGIGCLEEPVEPADAWIWLINHSNQIGIRTRLAKRRCWLCSASGNQNSPQWARHCGTRTCGC